MDHPFFGPGGRRAIESEVITYIKDQLGAQAVSGFDRILDLGGARHACDRISNFQETHKRDEWLLPLSASEPLVLQTAAVPKTDCDQVAFVLSLGFGNGSPLPEPSGQWDIYVNDRLAVSTRMVNHRQLWRQGECALAFDAKRVECAEPFGSLTLSTLISDEMLAAFGPAFLTVPTDWLATGEGARIRIKPHCESVSSRWLQLAPPMGVLQYSDFYGVMQLLKDPHPRIGDHRVYFGDIHSHSGQVMDRCENEGCGYGTRKSNYRYAKGPGGLDFYALTDHEWQIDPKDIDGYLSLADSHDEPGRFACLPAFEYTNLLYGHRNIYFRDRGGTVFNTARDWGRPTLDPDNCHTPDDLWAALEATGVPFLSIPHHPSAASHPSNPDFYNPEYDRLMEVYSCWGSSEYYGDFPRGVSDRWRRGGYRAALERGQRYGVTAGADGHDGHPGNAQSPRVKHHHLFHFCGSGRTAVLSPELSREAVFDAMYERRCYATTGPPILMNVRVNGAVMGSEIALPGIGERPVVLARIDGTAGLDHVRFMKNGEVAHVVDCHGRWSCEAQWEDENYGGADPVCYWVRVVQKDHESAWSSPVWLG